MIELTQCEKEFLAQRQKSRIRRDLITILGILLILAGLTVAVSDFEPKPAKEWPCE